MKNKSLASNIDFFRDMFEVGGFEALIGILIFMRVRWAGVIRS